MYLIAILFPGLSFLFRGKIIHFIICILLQLTLIGWLPAAIWAVFSISEERNNKRMRQMQITIQNVSTQTASTHSNYSELERLNKLRESGALTEVEFQAEKKKILG